MFRLYDLDQNLFTASDTDKITPNIFSILYHTLILGLNTILSNSLFCINYIMNVVNVIFFAKEFILENIFIKKMVKNKIYLYYLFLNNKINLLLFKQSNYAILQGFKMQNLFFPKHKQTVFLQKQSEHLGRNYRKILGFIFCCTILQ